MERSPDWQQFILDQPMSAAPGTAFYYGSGNSHLLSAILTKVTGKSALDYARETLFGPLGIDDVMWRWPTPQGVSGGGAGLYMHPRDMAKIGYLYLRGGLWEGKQILPASWIEAVRKADIDMRESWTKAIFALRPPVLAMPGRDAYMAVGHDRQLIVVMPKLDIVAVMHRLRPVLASEWPAGQTALRPHGTGRPTCGRRDCGRAGASRSRGDGTHLRRRSRTQPSSGRGRPASSSVDGQGRSPGKTWRFAARPNCASRRLTLQARSAPSRPSNTSPKAAPATPAARVRRADWFRRVPSRRWAPCAAGRAPPAAPWSAGRQDLSSWKSRLLGSDDAARLLFAIRRARPSR